jgi:hypothetical protein
MNNKNILEEEIKNTVAERFFAKFDCTKIIGKIDFTVKLRRPNSSITVETVMRSVLAELL